MKTIVMLSQKGGSGKTTLAIHIAVAALMEGKKVLMLDTDPQRSAEAWHHSRKAKAAEPRLAVVEANKAGNLLDLARQSNIDVAIIDTMPHTAGASSMLAQYADIILIPCQPTVLDLSVVGNSVNIARARNKPAVIIINRAPSKAPEIKLARAALARFSMPIYPNEIADRRAYFRSLMRGLAVNEFEPESAAAKEMTDLWTWTKEQING